MIRMEDPDAISRSPFIVDTRGAICGRGPGFFFGDASGPAWAIMEEYVHQYS